MRQLLFCIFSCLMVLPATAKEWQVTPDSSIERSISLAAPGDTIKVARGYYHEQIVINKPLTLLGIDRPTISGDNKPGDVIRINVPDVRVEGFIVRDSGDNLTAQNAGIYIEPGAHRAQILHNDIAYTLFSLWIEKSNDVQIVGNLITGKRDTSLPNEAMVFSSITPLVQRLLTTISASRVMAFMWMCHITRHSSATRCIICATGHIT